MLFDANIKAVLLKAKFYVSFTDFIFSPYFIEFVIDKQVYRRYNLSID